MAGAYATADGPRDAFRKQLRIASARFHLERLSRASWPISWSLTVALWLVLMLAFFTPLVAYAVPMALALLVAGVLYALSIYFARLDRRRLLVRMDAHGKLPDSVLTAGDWEDAGDDPWRQRQRAETIRLLENVDWKKAWPVTWPRLLWLPLVSSLLLLGALWCVQHSFVQKNHLAHLAEDLANAPVPKEKLKPLEQIFKDWDDAQKIAPSPELAQLLKQIKPMRDEMANGDMTEKQVLLKLNDIQAELQAQKDKLDASSLEPVAKSMADAVKDLDGMSGLAAALSRKDFAAAKEQAAQAEEKYNSNKAKMPEGNKAQAAASKLGETAQKASQNSQVSSSLSKMQSAVSQKDGSAMGKGLAGLKEGLGEQAGKDGQGKSLGLQMAQISSAKDGLGKGEGMSMGAPQLSLAKSLEPGKGAGSTVDPNRFGAQTQLDAGHQDMKITGTAGDGASEKQTETTFDPHTEQTASGVNAAQFSEYKKLSEEATQDENLPVADRQMIKRYFEDIRPQTHP